MDQGSRVIWANKLAALIHPTRGAAESATAIVKLLAFLDDLPDRGFTEESLRAIAPKLRRTPNVGELSDAILTYLRDTGPKRETLIVGGRPRLPWDPPDESFEQQRERLGREWDDPAGIRARIATCQGELKYLRLLALIVARHAPQHLGLIPPHVLEALDAEKALPGSLHAGYERVGLVLDADGSPPRTTTPAAGGDEIAPC